MKRTPKKQKLQVRVNPNYNPDNVIVTRRYGVEDLEKYLKKIKQNINIFKEAINKEKAEMKKTEEMIKVLKNDIYEAKMLKRMKKQ
jgi:hypothetical protein